MKTEIERIEANIKSTEAEKAKSVAKLEAYNEVFNMLKSESSKKGVEKGQALIGRTVEEIKTWNTHLKYLINELEAAKQAAA